MATVIDSLVLELGIDGSKFKADAKNATKSVSDLKTGLGGTLETFKSVRGAAGALFKVLAAVGLERLVNQITELNTKLGSTAANLGVTSQALKEWQNVAELAGGSAEGVTSTMQSLSKAQTEMSVTGQTSMLPYMRALGVSMFDARGKARPLNDMLLDLADRFSGLDRVTANNFGQMMGIDQDTLNVLIQGRGAMMELVEQQKNLHKSTQAEAQASKELQSARRMLSLQLESLATIIVNAITPSITKMLKVVTGFIDFLNKHEKFAKGFFIGIAGAITLALLPALWSAAAAVFALIVPFLAAAAPVLALAAAFGVLYDDYQTWAEGGESLFDWGQFEGWIDDAGGAVGRTNKAFLKLIGDYKTWSEVGNSAFDWLRFKGWIDESGVSVDSLRNGFVNLAKDIVEKVKPILDWTLGVWDKLSSGDMSGAWEIVKSGGEAAYSAMSDLFKTGVDRVVQFGKDVANPNFGKQSIPALNSGVADYGGRAAGGKLQLTERDIQDIIKVTSTEVVPSLKGKDFQLQTRGVVDTILNRAMSGAWGAKGDVRAVVNARHQFSAISGNKNAYGSVQAMPDSAIKKKVADEVIAYLQARAAGQESSVGDHLNYANPDHRFLTPNNYGWVDALAIYARRNNLEFGSGNATHVHGTTSGLQKRRPGKFNVEIPSIKTTGYGISNQSAIKSSMFQATNAGRFESPSISNVSKNVDVRIGEIKVSTTASTIGGIGAEAYAALRNNVTQIESGLT